MHRHKTYDEKIILEMLSQGSEYAFTILFDHYRARIYGVAVKFLKSRELAEEVVQEVFFKLWVKRTDLSRIVNFEAYLFAMARNKVLDGIKEMAEELTARKAFVHSIRYVDATDHPLIEQQYEELLDRTVNRLPPQQKQIFQLAKVEGLSHQVIAEQLHISRLTVKTHMAKALQTIRHDLQHYITTFTSLPVILRIFDQSM